MRKKSSLFRLFIFIFAVGVFSTACNQKYFFRQKVSKDNDSAQVEKTFQIVW